MLKKMLILALALFACGRLGLAQTVRVVRLTTADDIGIMAAYYPVNVEPAPAVLLLHSLGRSRNEWSSFAQLLQQQNVASLAIDLRGHGESSRRLTAQGPQLVDYQSFTPRDFQDMLLDVNVAVDWLTEQPGIDKHRIAVVGSSLGANVALRYATYNDDLAGIALLSPGINYRGIRTDDAITKLTSQRLRIIVARNDPFAFESSKRLDVLRKEAGRNVETNELVICTGNLHGTDLLTGVNGLPQLLINWLKEVFQAGGSPPAAPASPPVSRPSEPAPPPAGK